MTKPDLKSIRERCEKATPGEWMVCVGSGICVCTGVKAENPETGETTFIADFLSDSILDKSERDYDHRANMEFVANARQDIPALLDYIEKLEAVAEAARKVDVYEDFSDPIISDEYDPTEHNEARLKLYEALAALDGDPK